ncbi:MAG: hypothetical protein IH940_01235 [Acidobacteria bacterium]|nr:hypothetical protein [Acidobacteriota bacterium]
MIEIDHLGLDTTRCGHGGAPQNLLPPLRVSGYRDRSWAAVAGGLSGLVLEFLEQTGRVGGQLGEAVRRLELRDEASGMPCGTAGQGSLLQDDDICDPASGQVIRHAAADNSATNDDHLGAVG